MILDRWSRHARLLLATAGTLLALGYPSAVADGPPRVVVDARDFPIRAGRYSFAARFQAELQKVLDACGRGAPPVVAPGREATGTIDAETTAGLRRAMECDRLRAVTMAPGMADGVLTEPVWSAVMANAPLPTFEERAMALVLSFEATDFGDRPEWNFCQDSATSSRSISEIAKGRAACVNRSDPCSLLTWGPRGATAGSGREIQWVVWLALKDDPDVVARAFGSEIDPLKRFLRLKGGGAKKCDGTSPLERFMCGVWIDPVRRRRWEQALASLGRDARVRRFYKEVYASEENDGGKLREFFALWAELDLKPTEVDYAFFIDRATHLGGPNSDTDRRIAIKVRQCVATEKGNGALTANGAARRCIALSQPHPTQAEARLARDVAYYLDAYQDGALPKREIQLWAALVPLTAVNNFNLSDQRFVTLPTPSSLFTNTSDWPRPDIEDLSVAERTACPASILSSIRRK